MSLSECLSEWRWNNCEFFRGTRTDLVGIKTAIREEKRRVVLWYGMVWYGSSVYSGGKCSVYLCVFEYYSTFALTLPLASSCSTTYTTTSASAMTPAKMTARIPWSTLRNG